MNWIRCWLNIHHLFIIVFECSVVVIARKNIERNIVYYLFISCLHMGHYLSVYFYLFLFIFFIFFIFENKFCHYWGYINVKNKHCNIFYSKNKSLKKTNFTSFFAPLQNSLPNINTVKRKLQFYSQCMSKPNLDRNDLKSIPHQFQFDEFGVFWF